MDNSILIVKPDGFRFLEEINREILAYGFSIISKHHVFSWDEMFKMLNKDIMKKRPKLFRDEVEAHIWLLKYLFGNYAQVWVLKKDDLKDEELLNEITRFKDTFRSKYDASRNGTFMIIADMRKLNFNPTDIKLGYLGTCSSKDFRKIDKFISQKGKFDSFYLKYIHSPDPILSDAEREIGILKNSGIISDETIISEKEWSKMIYFNRLINYSK